MVHTVKCELVMTINLLLTYNFEILMENIVLCEYNFRWFDKTVFLYNTRLRE